MIDIFILRIIYLNIQTMTRTVRNLDYMTKEKISNSMRNKSKSEETRKKISNAMKKYWSTIPVANSVVKQKNDNNNKPSTEIPTL